MFSSVVKIVLEDLFRRSFYYCISVKHVVKSYPRQTFMILNDFIVSAIIEWMLSSCNVNAYDSIFRVSASCWTPKASRVLFNEWRPGM